MTMTLHTPSQPSIVYQSALQHHSKSQFIANHCSPIQPITGHPPPLALAFSVL